MSIRWWVRSLLRSSRPHWPDANEWLALEGYRGLVSQAFAARPFNPVVATSLWIQGQWQAPDQSLRSPSRRERDNASITTGTTSSSSAMRVCRWWVGHCRGCWSMD